MNNSTTTFALNSNTVTLQVSKDLIFRGEIAEALVIEAHPGYHGQGFYYVDPVEGHVYFKGVHDLQPWSDDVDWRIVWVGKLGDPNSDYSPVVDDWGGLLTRDIKLAYLAFEGEEPEENDDIPEWLSDSEVINWACENIDGMALQVEEYEAAALEAAIDLAESDIVDEVTIELE